MIDARFEETDLVLSGTGPRPRAVLLEGPRALSDATLTGRGKTWKARLPLRVSRWGGPALALPSGQYRLSIEPAEGVDGHGELPSTELTVLDGLRARLDGDESVLTVGPPIDPVYDSIDAQTALERRYVARTSAALENAVFFESFYGRNASCNPLALDREIARVSPGVVRYWSVDDLSVEVPDGAIAVVEGSPEWWRARGAARLLVVNDWLRRRYARHPGQRVIQTWHGTPLKRLALHRPGFDPRRMAAVVRESLRWDVLLAQNPYAARMLKKAYAFFGRPVWVEGYPRNDVLVAPGEATAQTRQALGIGDDEPVILWAPTWRDDRAEIVDFLDPAELARDMSAVVLVRGHSRTLRPGRDARGPRVIDVTGFPDTSRLFLAADVMVTDYSSVMFDFTVTGKPIVFFVPDLKHYRGESRGFYFDLDERAPGAVVHTTEDLTVALGDVFQTGGVPAAYAERYASWRARFNARDDGRAAERVVARIFDQGFLQR